MSCFVHDPKTDTYKYHPHFLFVALITYLVRHFIVHIIQRPPAQSIIIDCTWIHCCSSLSITSKVARSGFSHRLCVSLIVVQGGFEKISDRKTVLGFQ
ncbi:hypothetical protein L6452_35479 [Arctium lappa]|uniref:Uncharacterized protein n=1 Tax=Arctium lappa TaxID=4217 RepID=A0ACB8Y5X7_ARCLA|nr:hypothetical protein L6452_35479 [Arctium lappa]